MIKEIQEVKLALKMDGQYCAFHECCVKPIYDFTNDKVLEYLYAEDFYAEDEDGEDEDEDGEEIEDVFDVNNREKIINFIENYSYEGDGDDFKIVDGYLIDGEYYYKF